MSSPMYCPDCKGTGQDAEKTKKARKTGVCDKHSYIRCWNCNGNGLDPWAYFISSRSVK